jgi:hypothetical protein
MTILDLPDDKALQSLIEARANHDGVRPEDAAQALFEQAFHGWIRSLHQQFMAGEISQGRMSELVGVSRRDLIHLLETMDLSVTNL